VNQQSKLCTPAPDTVCFGLPFLPSPQILDAFALQLPVVLIPALLSTLIPSSIPFVPPLVIGFSYLLVGGFWWLLLSLISREWPAKTRSFRAIHLWLVVMCMLVFAGSFLSWVLAASPHGPTGAFGITIGSAITLYALRRSRPAKSPKSGQGAGDQAWGPPHSLPRSNTSLC
jgi:hypothetical protein